MNNWLTTNNKEGGDFCLFCRRYIRPLCQS